VYGILGIGALLGGPFSYALIAVTFGIAWFYASSAFESENLPGWRGMPAAYYRDAFFIGLGGTAAILGLRTLLLTASQHAVTAHRAVEASFGGNFDAALPGAAIIAGMVNHSLLYTGIVAMLASFVAARLRTPWLRLLVFLLASLALIGSNWGSPADLVKQWLAQLILLAAITFGVRHVMRFNIFGCFLVLALLTLVEQATEFVGQPNAFYRLNGYAIVAAMLALVLWPLTMWRVSLAQERPRTP